jgi:hypothetical protein
MSTVDGTYRVVVVCVHVLDDSLLGSFIRSILGRHCDRIGDGILEFRCNRLLTGVQRECDCLQ